MNKLDLLRQAKAKVDELVADKRRQEAESDTEKDSAYLAVMMNSVDAIIESINSVKVNEATIAEAVRSEIAKLQIPPSEVNIPEIKLPPINIPEAKVTVSIPEITVPEPKVTVNVPKIEIPEIKAPNVEVNMPDSMEIHGDVGLFGYGFDNPLPVQLRDKDGNPVSLPEMMSVASSGGGSRFVKVINDASEPIPITGSITSTPGATYYASDAVGSVNIVQSIPLSVSVSGATGTIGVVTINPDGLPTYAGGSSGGGLTDAELRASSVPVEQVSGSIWSTSVTSMPSVTVSSITASTGVSILGGDGQTVDPRNRTWTITETVPVSAGATLTVDQLSGASWSTNVLSMPSVTVTGITNSTAITLLNGEGVARDTWGASQVGTWTISSITNSSAASLIDSSGIQYSGSNPVPITWVSGAGVSTAVHISDSTGVGYSGSNPVPIAGTVVVSSVTASTASALVDSTGVQYSGSNPLPTKEIRSATPSQTSPSVGVASTSILAANASRLGATIYNEGSAICYMKLGSTASLTSYTLQIASGGYYEVPFGYTGAIDGITSASTAQLRVTEIT